VQHYGGRLHRLHDAKRIVKVYDYIDSNVLMLARMYARRLKGYNVIGYRICSTDSEDSLTERQGSGLDKIDVEKLGINTRHGGGAD